MKNEIITVPNTLQEMEDAIAMRTKFAESYHSVFDHFAQKPTRCDNCLMAECAPSKCPCDCHKFGCKQKESPHV